MKRFAGRPAIVTAAASGIGRAIALRLHEEGAQVLAVDINDEGLAALPRSETLRTFVADVTAEGAPQAIVDECRRRFDGIRVLVNNAGLGNCPPFHETTDADYQKYADINQKATFMITRAALPAPLFAANSMLRRTGAERKVKMTDGRTRPGKHGCLFFVAFAPCLAPFCSAAARAGAGTGCPACRACRAARTSRSPSSLIRRAPTREPRTARAAARLA